MYKPTPKTVALLESAMGHINSVPYDVGLRWVFYRLLQEGTLDAKANYKTLVSTISKARKEWWGGWQPDTLIDSGRSISLSHNPTNRDDILAILPLYINLVPDLYEEAEAVPFLLFEADTMVGQFEYFAPWCDSAAFRGDASIPHKWNIAKRCDELAKLYGKPVHILYFGDYDFKGLQIPESAMDDIEDWADVGTEILFTRYGITIDQAQRYGLPQKPNSPNTYEWEALNSDDAGEIILNALREIVDLGDIEEKQETAMAETAYLITEVTTLLEDI